MGLRWKEESVANSYPSMQSRSYSNCYCAAERMRRGTFSYLAKSPFDGEKL
jgi:hypothetical protein